MIFLPTSPLSCLKSMSSHKKEESHAKQQAPKEGMCDSLGRDNVSVLLPFVQRVFVLSRMPFLGACCFARDSSELNLVLIS